MTSVFRYKLTTADGKTYNDTQWGPGVTHSAPGKGSLCSNGWIHVYNHPLVALIFNPVHGDFRDNAILWKCRCWGSTLGDKGTKEGWQHVKTIKPIEKPKLTEDRVRAFAILSSMNLVKKYPPTKEWLDWAKGWLNGERVEAKRKKAYSSSYSYSYSHSYYYYYYSYSHASDLVKMDSAKIAREAMKY